MHIFNQDGNAKAVNQMKKKGYKLFYGIVDDLFKVIPAFKEKIIELKQTK